MRATSRIAREPRPPARLPRALALAGAAALIGTGSHVLGGGAVHVAGLCGALTVLLALAWPLTGRERSWLAILGVQLVGQLAGHALLQLGDVGHHLSRGGVPADAWFYGHVATAVVVSTWLRHAERRTWAGARRAATVLAARWRRLVALLAERPDAPPPALAALVVDRPLAPGRHALRHAVVRRGPPLPA
jgi:hypothetical protein